MEVESDRGVVLGLSVDGTVIDEIAAYPSWSGASSQVDPDHLDADENDLTASWCQGYSSYGWGDLGTPGAANECPADDDADGYDVLTDCDDGDASVHPGATDTWYDGIDSDCDGAPDYDQDGDGYDLDTYGGDDCDDTSRRIRPSAVDNPSDGIDQDCDGADASGTTMLDLDTLAAGDLIFSEFMVWPASAETQWLEIYNASGQTVYLDGLTLSTEYYDVEMWDGPVLAAGEYAVVASNGDTRRNGGVNVDWLDPSFMIGEGERGTLGLYADSTAIDTVRWMVDRVWPVSWGASTSLAPTSMDGTANDSGANWCLGSTAYGAGDLGTPGSANDPC
jgi:hypothetical protein